MVPIGAILYLCQISFVTNCFQTQLCVSLIKVVFSNSLLTHSWSDLLLINFWLQTWNPTLTITELQLYSTTYFSLTSQVKIAPPSFANLQQVGLVKQDLSFTMTYSCKVCPITFQIVRFVNMISDKIMKISNWILGLCCELGGLFWFHISHEKLQW